MKTAVLISGQMRTFAQNAANLNWQVFRKLENPTFFVSCADDEQAKDAYLLEGYAKEVHIERVTQPTLDEPAFVMARHSPYSPTPNNPSVVQSIMRQLWHYKRVWDFMQSKPQDFEVVVRCRPDLHFHRFDYRRPGMTEFIGPWKATCGGVNDRFSVMGASAAGHYFNAIDHLQAILDAGCPLHPESIQQAALEAGKCTISNTLQAEFTCMRLSGNNHIPLIEYPGEMARFIEATRHLAPRESVWTEPYRHGMSTLAR